MSYYVIAPDSFKGTLRSQEVADLIEEEILKQNQKHQVKKIIMSDGGEGFLEAMTLAHERFKYIVVGPLGEPVEALYGVKDDTFIIEMAQCAGLMLLSKNQLNPKVTTTYGVGQLIRLAIEQGFKEIVIGIGGSATNDGGTGMLAALGAKFYNDIGQVIKLPTIEQVYDLHVDELRIPADLHITVASDVTNPLCGKDGATYTFAEQKGLSQEHFEAYDQHMNRVGLLYEQKSGKSVRHQSGAGAAGGIGAALLSFFHTTMISGAELVLKKQQFTTYVQKADWVITGEGKTDRQTLNGKAPYRIAHEAKRQQKKTMLLSGKIENKEDLATYFDEMYEIISLEITTEEALNSPKQSLQTCLQQISFQ